MSAVFTEIRLEANIRQRTIDKLQVFTVYQVKVAAINEKGPGPYTPTYLGTTGEQRKRKLILQLISLTGFDVMVYKVYVLHSRNFFNSVQFF